MRTTKTSKINLAEAINIIRKLQDGGPPIMLVPIAEKLGLKVKKHKGWSNNISGKLVRDDTAPAGFTIYSNADHPAQQRRYTVAHHIAHFLLHSDKIDKFILEDTIGRGGLNIDEEAEANALALFILMPSFLLNKEIESGKDSIPELADIFKVSQTAMALRLGVPNEV